MLQFTNLLFSGSVVLKKLCCCESATQKSAMSYAARLSRNISVLPAIEQEGSISTELSLSNVEPMCPHNQKN